MFHMTRSQVHSSRLVASCMSVKLSRYQTGSAPDLQELCSTFCVHPQSEAIAAHFNLPRIALKPRHPGRSESSSESSTL